MLRSLWDRSPALFIFLGLGPLIFSTFIGVSEAWAQAAPVIVHEGIDCLVTNHHAILKAVVDPPSEVRVVRVYFRSALYPEFYFIEMKQEGEQFQAVLPKPKPETKRVLYYIEAVTNDFNTSRTTNYEPQVMPEEGDCDDDDVVPAYFIGTDPNIVIGVTSAGLPAIPPGFYAAGIAGGGLPRTTALLIGAGGAGAAAVAIGAGGGGGSEPPEPAPPTTSTTTSATTTTTTVPTTPGENPVACFETDPDPPIIQVGESVTFDARCSKAAGQQLTGWRQQSNEIVRYEWDFGDGRGGKEGPRVQRAYFTAGIFTATLTVTDQAGRQDSTREDVRVEEEPPPPPPTTSTTSTTSTTTTTTTTIPPMADLEITGLSGPGNVAANTDAAYDVTVLNNGPEDDPTVTLTTTFSSSSGTNTPTLVSAPGCSSSSGAGALTVVCNFGTLNASVSTAVTITVQYPANDTYQIDAAVAGGGNDPSPGNNNMSMTTGVPLQADSATFDTILISSLEVPPPDGTTRAQVSLNGSRIDNTDNSTPFRHRFSGRAGENLIEAHIIAGEMRDGRWRFDFREAPHFVRGSIQVASGQVLSQGPYEVVFRVSGASGPQVRFRYRLEH